MRRSRPTRDPRRLLDGDTPENQFVDQTGPKLLRSAASERRSQVCRLVAGCQQRGRIAIQLATGDLSRGDQPHRLGVIIGTIGGSQQPKQMVEDTSVLPYLPSGAVRPGKCDAKVRSEGSIPCAARPSATAHTPVTSFRSGSSVTIFSI